MNVAMAPRLARDPVALGKALASMPIHDAEVESAIARGPAAMVAWFDANEHRRATAKQLHRMAMILAGHAWVGGSGPRPVRDTCRG